MEENIFSPPYYKASDKIVNMTSKTWLLFWLFILILFIHPLGEDGDFYHHINTGRYILTHFQLPRLDEWTFTANGKPWVAHSWAAGVLFYLIYTSFGVVGISIFVALIGTLTLFLIYFLLKSYNLKNTQIFPLIFLLISLFLIRFPARPEIFAYPLLILILLIDRQATKSSRLFLLYPLIIFSWSILYGANVFVGLGMLVFLLIKRWGQVNRVLVLSILLSFLISFFNGYGLDTIFYILKISKISQIQGEWLGILSIFQKAPPDYLYLFKFRLAIYAIFLIFSLTMIVTHLKLIKNHQWEFILSLTIFLPFFTFRQVSLGTLLSLPFLSVIFKSYKSSFKLSTTLWVLGTASILITFFYNPPRLEFTEDSAKLALTSFISDHNLSGNAYTTQQIGSYISFKFYPQILVSYDTRDDLFAGGKFLKDSISGAPLELILQRYHCDFVILDTYEDNQKADYLLHSPNWVKVYLKDNFLVMKRK